jgi:hypothetical protein
MRMLMKVQMDVEAGNRAILDGSWERIMGRFMEEAHPEAVYFTAENGKRTGFIFVDVQDVSDIPSLAEPFFMSVGASIDFSPVMTVEDVKRGLQKAAKAFEHDGKAARMPAAGAVA